MWEMREEETRGRLVLILTGQWVELGCVLLGCGCTMEDCCEDRR